MKRVILASSTLSAVDRHHLAKSAAESAYRKYERFSRRCDGWGVMIQESRGKDGIKVLLCNEIYSHLHLGFNTEYQLVETATISWDGQNVTYNQINETVEYVSANPPEGIKLTSKNDWDDVVQFLSDSLANHYTNLGELGASNVTDQAVDRYNRTFTVVSEDEKYIELRDAKHKKKTFFIPRAEFESDYRIIKY